MLVRDALAAVQEHGVAVHAEHVLQRVHLLHHRAELDATVERAAYGKVSARKRGVKTRAMKVNSLVLRSRHWRHA